MARERMRRTAADNVYLHKDFHGALSAGLDYIAERYGDQAVRDYLRQFAAGYYAPLREKLKERGLAVLKEHFERIYTAEGAAVRATLGPDELLIEVDACPAVRHMRANGYTVSRLFSETTRTVNEALCEGTPYRAELLRYRDEDGQSVQRFLREPS